MNDLKTQLKKLVEFLATLTLLTLLFTHPCRAYDPDLHDRFFLPLDDPINYSFDGQITDSEKRDVNWFTFGTEGQPEVTVYGRYHNDSLFLAFNVDYDMLRVEDMLTICIDPFNSGGSNPPDNILIRYDISPFDEAKQYHTWDYEANNWVINPQSPIDCEIYNNSLQNYYEVEVEIDCKAIMSGLGSSFFGLYFQVNDFVDPTDYSQYYWPTTVDRTGLLYDEVPSADEWANAIFVTNAIETQPDVFFNKYLKSLWTDYTNDLLIKPGARNTIHARIHNMFFAGIPDGEADTISLTLQYSDFGVSSFTDINTMPHDFSVSANDHTIESIDWKPLSVPTSGPDTVCIHAEFSYNSDPITCNNTTRRRMQYIRVVEEEDVQFTASIENVNEEQAMDFAPLHYASAMPYQFESESKDKSNFLYFYLDRSGLDPSVPAKDWNISFITTGPTKDSIIYLDDRDSLAFGKKDMKTFKIRLTAPKYKSLSKHKPISTLRVKVSRKKESYKIKDKIYNRMEILGYFGAAIKVIKRPSSFGVYVKLALGILFLLGGGYFLYYKVKD